MMNRDKDIKFPDKKVDSSWKEQASKERVSAPLASSPSQPASSTKTTSREFMGFLKSLATQALMSLGEMPNPVTGESEVDLATAKEMIDLLSVLKLKTQGNCSAEENNIFNAILPELQLKFSQQA